MKHMKRLMSSGVIALGLMALTAGCTTPSQESRSAVAQWIGKNRVDLTNQMGQPKSAVPLTDTGGEDLFYSYQGHHYVFETGPDGQIISAVQTK